MLPIDRTQIKQILIMKFLHIGDVLLITPALRALRESYPHARLTALINSGSEEMLEGNPCLDEIMIYQRRKGCGWGERFALEWRLLREIRRCRFDMTVDLTGGDRPAILGLLSGARYRVGPHPEGKGMWGKGWFYTHADVKRNHRQHMVEQNLDIVRQIGVDTTDHRLSFLLSREEVAFAHGLFEAHGIRKEDLKIHIHPTSRWLFKCWRDESFAQLMDRLWEEHQARIIVTCGPDPREVAKARGIVDQVKVKPMELIGRTTLRELGAISKASDLFIGVDSAPMHLAAAVGIPTIALFGPTGDFNWHPWCVEHRVLKKSEGCDPNGSAGCTQTKRCLCLERISVDEVMEAFHSIMATLPRSLSEHL